MNYKNFICTEGLPFRIISPRERREAQVVRHFERLSGILYNANGDAKIEGSCIIVNDLTVDQRNNGNGTTPKVLDKFIPVKMKSLFGIGGLRDLSMNNDIATLSGKWTALKNYDRDGESSKMVEKTMEKAFVKVTDSLKNHEQIYGWQPKKLACNNENYNYVDVEGLTKLRKLCGMLRSNVIELKTVYEHRNNHESNVNSDQTDLEMGLRSLDNDLMQLFNRLDDMKGSPKEMKKAVNMYRDYELQYRCLRTLNRKVKRTMRSNQFCRFIRDYLCCLCIKKTQWYED